MVPGPNTRAPAAADLAALAAIPAQMAVLSTRVLNANGQPMPNGQPLPRGRAVLEVTMDALAGQRVAGRLAGAAGFKVWLDNVELVAVPTALAGPGIGGTWRIAFDPSRGAPGQHVIDVRAFGAQHGVAFGEAFTSFTIAQ
jgi:hypothetical protein